MIDTCVGGARVAVTALLVTAATTGIDRYHTRTVDTCCLGAQGVARTVIIGFAAVLKPDIGTLVGRAHINSARIAVITYGVRRAAARHISGHTFVGRAVVICTRITVSAVGRAATATQNVLGHAGALEAEIRRTRILVVTLVVGLTSRVTSRQR